MPSTQQLRNSAVGNRTARRCPWEPSGRYACNAHTIRVWGTAGSVRLGGARQDLSACPERPTDPCARLPPRCSHRSRKGSDTLPHTFRASHRDMAGTAPDSTAKFDLDSPCADDAAVRNLLSSATGQELRVGSDHWLGKCASRTKLFKRKSASEVRLGRRRWRAGGGAAA